MVILSAKKLVKEYGTANAKTRVINDIDLDIREGDFIAITGESGSGKSTLLYLLAGLEHPDGGIVTYLGNNLSQMKDVQSAKLRRNGISFVYQFYNLINNLSIYDNIVLPKKIDSSFSLDEKKFLEELIDVAQLQHILKKLPAQVSGGEQQRAAIVRALFVRPKVILLDEPTGNLDSANALKIMSLLTDINTRYNTTVVMVTHSAELSLYAKRIVTLKDGRIHNA
ncbi:MAG TPA: ABC transporter ATP-binding protein [Clostridia bacterium]|nr:ABC transporter ATP-binding protein [Clostridia bacterium]